MKSYEAPSTPTSVVDAMQRLVEAGAAPLELISAMRAAGLSMIPSIKLLAKHFHLTTAEAKNMVHLSPTWADCRKSHDALHEAAEQVAKQPESMRDEYSALAS